MSKYTDLKNDFRIGLATIAIGIGVAVLTPLQVSDFSEGDNPIISGRTLPFLMSGILVLLGTLFSLSCWRELKGCTPDIIEHRRKGLAPETKRALIYFFAIGVYLVSIKIVGLEIASVFMIAFGMWYNGCRNKIAIVLGSILTPVVIYFAFVRMMYMVMPDSLLGDLLQNYL